MTTTMEDSSIEKKPAAISSSSWKLYDNPHFSINGSHHHPYDNKCCLTTKSKSKSRSSFHSRNFSDFFRAMDREPNLSDLDNAIALIKELRAELDFERRMRRKVELLNRTLAKELEEEKRRRKAAEEACGRMADEIASMREDSERCIREAEEERRMLRMAEAWREERVQMKLAEARLAMEDKYSQLLVVNSNSKGIIIQNNNNNNNNENNDDDDTTSTTTSSFPIKTPTKKDDEEEEKENIVKVHEYCLQRKEIENPHIKRGIKGGLEFPKAVRVRGSGGSGSSPSSSSSVGPREGRGGGGGLGSNLECQRAQLRVLLRHRNPAASVIMGPPHNLVM